jgi:hypothetical protein
MTTPSPTSLNGQILGQAGNATRALLNRLLAESQTPVNGWIALNLANSLGGTAARAVLIDRMVDGLKEDEPTVVASVQSVLDAGLLAPLPDDPSQLTLTEAGRERFAEISAGVGRIAQSLYGSLPPEDLATAGRVLSIVTERANALLAA